MNTLEEIARRGNEIVQQRRRGEQPWPTLAWDADDAWAARMNGRRFESYQFAPTKPIRMDPQSR